MTMTEFGTKAKIHLGGVVMARSVKYLGKLASKLSDQETRDAWWAELRAEARSHARSLCCTHILGYSETCTIHDDVIVLSCVGTAATIRNLLTLPDISASGGGGGTPRISAATVTPSGEGERDDGFGHELHRRRQHHHHKKRSAVRHSTTEQSVGDDANVDNVLKSNVRVSADDPGQTIDAAGVESSMTLGAVPASTSLGISASSASKGKTLAADVDATFTEPGDGVRLDAGATNSTAASKVYRRRARARGKKQADGGDGVSANDRRRSRSRRGHDKPARTDRLHRVRPCSMAHVPYHHSTAPFSSMKLVPCGVCGRKWVPELILSTTEPTSALPVRGHGTIVQARVCRLQPQARRSTASGGESLVVV